ncbi:MAG: hypothetical protein JWR38_3702 [Mucilaginibacter sp.]|nr:hypothetical protein [Mucilaginibacter sp.]
MFDEVPLWPREVFYFCCDKCKKHFFLFRLLCRIRPLPGKSGRTTNCICLNQNFLDFRISRINKLMLVANQNAGKGLTEQAWVFCLQRGSFFLS